MPRYEPVDPAQSFPELEERVLERWRERDVFHESIRRREGGKPFVFYEGPPTANGRPGSHHVLSRVFKDVFPRYRTMRGHLVHRKAGWDCHGLPVELEIERELGIKSKDDIERFGIAEFNAQVPLVGAHLHRRVEQADRADRLLDRHRPGLLHARQRLHRVGLVGAQRGVEEGPALPGPQGRARTARAAAPRCRSHEVAQGYKDVVDPSVFVRFPVVGEPGVSLLGWTTTPWTLLSNAALAVHPDVTYVRARVGDEVLIVAEALVERVLGEDAEIESRMTGPSWPARATSRRSTT